MPEMHLRQRGFTYKACVTFAKIKQGIQKLKEAGDLQYIYHNELHKAFIQHYMAYGDFKDLLRRTAFDKVLGDKAFNVAKNPKYDGNQRRLSPVTRARSETLAEPDKSAIKSEIMLKQQLV